MERFGEGRWSLIGSAVHLLVCASFGAYACLRKGRLWFEGFVFGLLLGPMGVVAAACLPNGKGLNADKHVTHSAPGGQDLVEDDDAVKA